MEIIGKILATILGISFLGLLFAIAYYCVIKPIRKIKTKLEPENQSTDSARKLITAAIALYGAACMLAAKMTYEFIEPLPPPSSKLPPNEAAAYPLAGIGAFMLVLAAAYGITKKSKVAHIAVGISDFIPLLYAYLRFTYPEAIPLNGGIIWPILFSIALHKKIIALTPERPAALQDG